VPLLAFLELGRVMLRRYMQQQMKWHEFTVLPFIHRLRAKGSTSSALHVLFSVGHFFGSESFYFCAIPLLSWSGAQDFNGLHMPMLVTFFVANLYVGNFLKNLFALPRPTATPGFTPKEGDFGWPSMYATNAVALPFFALRYFFGAVGTGTPLSAHYQLFTAASYTAAFLWAGVVCGARLYSGVSSPADVQGGMLVGGVLVRLWLPICDQANAWIVAPDSQLFGAPQWLALLLLAALMVLVHPFTPNDPRSWTAIAYSVKAIAFGYSFILGSNACVRLSCAAMLPKDSLLGVLTLLLRNAVGFAALGLAWVGSKQLLATRLEKGLRTLLPSQRFLPVMARNLVAFSALGATISLGAPLLFQRLGI
jgi:membrane-associated phospholipid phosphatase